MADFVPFGKKPPRQGPPLLPEGAKVEQFQMRDLRQGSAPSYQAIKSNFDPTLVSKNARFMLSEHVANQLSVEQEDLMRFEKRVQQVLGERLTALSEETKVQAFEEGFAKGKAEAYEGEKARIARQLELLGDAVNSVVRAKDLLGEQYEKTMVDISFRLARIIVNHEIQDRPESIAFTLKDILSRISKEDDVMIHLPAGEFEVIDTIQKDIGEVARAGRVSFQIDQSLERGSCVVESLSGEIASSIEERFKRLEEEIFNKDNHPKKAEGA